VPSRRDVCVYRTPTWLSKYTAVEHARKASSYAFWVVLARMVTESDVGRKQGYGMGCKCRRDAP
jgi:hypothetical protein